MAKKITLSEVNKKRVRITAYLLISGILGHYIAILANYPQLQLIFGGAINFILYSLFEELKGEGYKAALK